MPELFSPQIRVGEAQMRLWLSPHHLFLSGLVLLSFSVTNLE
jgi:hypothetical protein